MRRQSLTGVMPPGQERSRRSSIGGKPIENGKKDHVFTPFRLNKFNN